MRKLIVILAAASVITAASAATVAAQVKGIRHSDGSWTFVDANGRDINKNDHAGRTARHDRRANAGSETPRHDKEKHNTGYLPWLSR